MELTVGRARISYIDEGKGTPVVLLHPFPLSAEVFRADADVLSDRMRIVAPSLRGFGETSPFDDGTSPSVDALADDLAALLEALAIPRAVVVGISLGGYVALAFARQHADKLAALVLADTRAEADSDEAKVLRDRNIARVTSGDFAGFVDDTIEALVAPETLAIHEEVPGLARALALQADPRSVIAMLRALRDRPDARPGLASVRVPTLVIVGENDRVTPPAAAEVMARGIAGAELHVVPRSGHLVNLEAPSAFREAIATFVARL